MSVQAIAGVSPRNESVIMTEYPSIAAGGLGQLLGMLYESIPLRIVGPKLSYLLFTLPTAPIGVVLYLLGKVFGHRYVLTNRAVQVWSARSKHLITSVSLDEVATVELTQHSGQVFYRASDIVMKAASGKTVLTLKGVPDAASFRNAIKCAADSRRQVKSSLAAIDARG